jgi:peptidoglycan-associated lipoprotein
VPLQDIFFDFDMSNIRDDQRAALDGNLTWLKANAAAKITIEGHADERGTNEYNLALGERRAKATKDYLVAAGIGAVRIATISYGEERPFVLGHDESAWKWNRRAHFVVTYR